MCGDSDSREPGGYVDDSTITAKVKTDLAEDNKVSASEVNVQTYKGVVDLSGSSIRSQKYPRRGSWQAK